MKISFGWIVVMCLCNTISAQSGKPELTKPYFPKATLCKLQIEGNNALTYEVKLQDLLTVDSLCLESVGFRIKHYNIKVAPVHDPAYMIILTNQNNFDGMIKKGFSTLKVGDMIIIDDITVSNTRDGEQQTLEQIMLKLI